MDVATRLAELAKLPPSTTPVVSVYLNTRWADEAQRERVRIFVKNEIRKARSAEPLPGESDLAWIEAQVQRLIEQTDWPEANGVALFACEALGLREALPLRVSVDDAFVTDTTPFLRPLAALAEEIPTALVVWVDGTSARLVSLDPTGTAEEATLESAVEGRHRTGGWAALAQSRYQRHIQEHREHHLAGVADVVAELTRRRGAERIVLAGEPRMVAALREHLPQPLGGRIVGVVAGARWEPASVIAVRAATLLGQADAQQEDAAVEAALTEAAKGGRAVGGMEATLEAVNRGAVRHLYLLKTFAVPGRVCEGCGALQGDGEGGCRFCGGPMRATELGEAMVDRVAATGGRVSVLERHPRLATHQGVAARLRYAA